MLYEWQQGCRNVGGGACSTPQILTDQLTLSQLRGRSYPPHYYSPPRIFRTSTGPLNTIKESICSQTIMNSYISSWFFLLCNPIHLFSHKSNFGEICIFSWSKHWTFTWLMFMVVLLSSVVFSELIFSKSNHLLIDNEHNRKNFSFCRRKHRLEKVFILVSLA